MILEIDAGNTSLKWRIVSAIGEVVMRGRQRHSQELADINKRLSGVSIQSARVACVAGQQTEMSIKQWLNNLGVLEVKFARTLKVFSGLQVAYQNPARLGVDRWLAMLAARKDHEACCVIDCGSAITVDLVNNQGLHMGGYIVPGLKTMQDGLLDNTRQINLENSDTPSSLGLGLSTSDAVNNGILRMSVSFLQSVLDDINANEDVWRIVITGGDRDLIKSFLSSDTSIQMVPELVLDGLHIALK